MITRNWETLPAVVLTLSIRSEFSQRLSLLSHFRSTLPSRPNKKVLPYSLPSVGPGADPGVQAVSPQVTWSHPPGGRLPLLSARPAVTFPAEERHRPSAGTKLYCLVTEAHACEQPAQGCYLEADRPRFEPATFWIASERSTVKPHRPDRPNKVCLKCPFVCPSVHETFDFNEI